MRKITKIEKSVPTLPTRKRVAAYARISEEKGRLLNSLSAQVSHYSAYIQKRPEWEYVGVYADSGESGTGKGHRDEFQRLIADCEAGKIDIVLTKTISRFARNTVDLLETVRRLRELGIEVRFEEQGINSMSGDGELMMTILASFAQEESRSLSENVKWSIRKRFEEGKPNCFILYGYRWNGEKFIVHQEEAEVVRLVYACYLEGMSVTAIKNQLKEKGIKTYTGKDSFSATSICKMLDDEKYIGTLKLQKWYVENHITHRDLKNKGELPMYIIEDAHEAIISIEDFEAVQAERLRRRNRKSPHRWWINTSVFVGKLKCGVCGAGFHRKKRKNASGEIFYYWRCDFVNSNNKTKPHIKTIPEDKIFQAATEALGLEELDEATFLENIAYILVPKDFQLIFHFTDSRVITKTWQPTAKKEAWTPERREAFGNKMRNQKFSPEERQARSERMKAQWAERRRQENEESGSDNSSNN